MAINNYYDIDITYKLLTFITLYIPTHSDKGMGPRGVGCRFQCKETHVCVISIDYNHVELVMLTIIVIAILYCVARSCRSQEAAGL